MYEIDVMFPVIEKAEELTGRRYGANPEDDVRFRVVADHVRSSMMLIGDGVTPGNESRGYVLRRLLRRAVRSMRLLGYEDRALPELFPVSRDKMGETYPELHRDWERISTVAFAEEDAFRADPAHRHDDLRHRCLRGEVLGRGDAVRRQGVRAARHLRLPDRPDPRDGGREGPAGRRGRLPPADGRAARPGQGRRARRRRASTRRHGAYREIADAIGQPGGVHRLLRGRQRGRRPRHRQRRRRRSSPPARATRSSWSSTGRRSTPRAAASSPTRASSSSTTVPGSRSTTCSRRSPA